MATTSAALPNERELLDRISKADEKAFTEIFHFYSHRILSFVFKKTKSKIIAEEIVQEVFLKLWLKREMATGIENFQSYIYTMVINKTFDYLKAVANNTHKMSNFWERMHHLATQNPVEERFDFRESQHIINKAIDLLPPQRKRIYLLSRMEGLSYSEIARELNISKNTVSNQLVEAVKFMRSISITAGTAIILMILEAKFYL